MVSVVVSVVCVVVAVGCGRGVCARVVYNVKTQCVHSTRLRVYVQKRRRVCRHQANMCFNMCARGAGTHDDVLNVHTGTF